MFRLNDAIKIILYQTLKIQNLTTDQIQGFFWNYNFISDDVGQCHSSFLLNCWVFPFDKFLLTRQNPVFSVDKLLVCYWQEIHYMQLWSWCFHRECTKLFILCYKKVKWKQKSWFCHQCGVDLKPSSTCWEFPNKTLSNSSQCCLSEQLTCKQQHRFPCLMPNGSVNFLLPWGADVGNHHLETTCHNYWM